MATEHREKFDNFYKNILSPNADLCGREFTLSGYSYGEVFELAAGIKTMLAGRGREKTLCLCTEKKSVTAACVLASLSGACQLILPYSFSAHALMEMQEATGFDAAIADHPEELPSGVEVITPLSGKISDLKPDKLRDPDKPFLRLFTGGSTGKPRVWTKSPRNLLAEAFYLKEKFELTQNDLFVATVPPYHIYGLLFSVLVPFAAQARILPDIYTFPQEIISAVNKHSATVLISVPAHYRSLKTDDLSVPSLKIAFSSSGALNRADAAHFYKKTGVGIAEIYGSTETGGVATRNISENTESWKPFDIVDWKIDGMDGSRLCIKSDFASEELPRDKDGFCMTGDEAAPDKDNRFSLLGRADGIVKVAGKRVDLIEVQNKIKTLPGVQEAVVISLPTEKGRESVIAALVVGDLTEAELRKMMKYLLEPYAIPRRVKIVPHIATTATGKIDRRTIEQILLSEEN
ncbi:MAG: long-chain fatty acid--CoA ligase [Syntrophaceae bacterium]|nr:long-chain fatty acid--CoA ligase [Syntrophaceae bacterium]